MIHPTTKVSYQTRIEVQSLHDVPFSIVCEFENCHMNAYQDEGPELIKNYRPFINCKNKVAASEEEDYHCYFRCGVGHLIDAIIVVKQGNKVIH